MKSFELHKIKDLEERSEKMAEIITEDKEVNDVTKVYLYQLLHKEAEERLSARDALGHNWITGSSP